MSDTGKPVKFEGGKNIAMKVPPHQHEATVRFYRDILKLEPVDNPQDDAICFKFGANNLWIDNVPGMSQAELWLEIVTNDTEAAAEILAQSGVARCDEIEPLGDQFDGYWISSPCAIIHLVDAKQGSWT
jgi:hypothetical protein